MAEPQEEIIIIQESEAADIGEDEQLDTELDDEAEKKKKIILFGGIAIILVLVIIMGLLLILKSTKNKQNSSIDFISEKLQEKDKKVEFEPSELENMIAKANYLYSTGSKKPALVLYEKIAQFSEAISLYNLGVAQLKDKQYQTAFDTFKQAINNDEKRCVSAINAAVCALHLEDQESFSYYIDLAYAYLPHEIDSPLYGYYYTLISYYNHNYLEALSILKHSKSNTYPDIQKDLKSKINALYGNDYDAIDAMEKNFEPSDDLSLGLLYARIGDFPLAISHFEESILKNIQPIRAQLALGLVQIKAGNIKQGYKEIKNVTDMFPKEVYKYYPIKVTLKESLFNAKKAQKLYRNSVLDSKMFNYQKIFYFSPYKIFNANHTISYIRKGNASIYIDNISSAKEYLQKSVSSSNVNYGITKAIKKALSFKIREANEELQKLIKIQPKHSILHYNLALTYAQMGMMTKAHNHFILSYHLDAQNYLSGVYAVMSAQLIDKDVGKLKEILKDSISSEEPSEERELYTTLLNISQNNYISSIEWLDNDYKQRPLYLYMNTLIASKLNKVDFAKTASRKLTAMLPHDILAHIIYIDSEFYDLKENDYASKVLNYLKKQDFNFQNLYYGPYISRYLYIQQNLITGKLFFLEQQLEKVLQETNGDAEELMSSLAMVYLYNKDFEKAYTLYNSLIDDIKMRDAFTLFLGAVASTAANHHENAIALLELANLKDRSFAESRFALGLLYLEVKNNDAAGIQLAHIQQDRFFSKYFDFAIDVDKLFFMEGK